jgi:arylsulfatase A-like enzyme
MWRIASMRHHTIRLLAALLTVTALGCSAEHQATRSQPNILLLVIDCLRADHVSANGYHRPTTPALDSLADDGLSFTQAISQSSWTRPSMPTLLTGLYPSEHGILELTRDESGVVIGPILAPEVDTLAERLAGAGYTSLLFGEQYQLSRKFGLAQGFEHYQNNIGGAEGINRRFLKWLDQNQPQRFFTLLHYFDIHWPYCPPPSSQGTFDEGGGDIDFCKRSRKLRIAIRRGEIALSEADKKTMVAVYDEELLTLDRTLARLFDDLRERQLWDNTLVIVTADHGEEFFEHGGIGHKNNLFDELIRVPVILRAPSDWPVERGRLLDTLVESRDVVATIEDAAGLETPTSARSLLPWLEASGGEEREYTVSESSAYLAVRTAKLKLILFRDEGTEVLYDLEADPLETVDVAADRSDDVKRLKTYLAQWRSNLKKTPPLFKTVDDDTTEGLRALGYLD